MKAEDIREARKEYEAEVYRQQHPYEQWISENEQQEKKTDFCGSLELDMDEFCALAGGGEREQRYFCGQLKGKEYVLVVSPMGAVDRRAYPLL
ncbi:MAG: hypothetical protein IJ600_13350, partial [Lachnospiraceae bacterium]|nr:hypothetical protein [Lachnospiraceae bacterium]